jgi:hypothetical protein
MGTKKRTHYQVVNTGQAYQPLSIIGGRLTPATLSFVEIATTDFLIGSVSCVVRPPDTENHTPQRLQYPAPQ